MREEKLADVVLAAEYYNAAQVAVEYFRTRLARACYLAHEANISDREIAINASIVIEGGITRGRIQQLRNIPEVQMPTFETTLTLKHKSHSDNSALTRRSEIITLLEALNFEVTTADTQQYKRTSDESRK